MNVQKVQDGFAAVADHLRSPLLLVLRLYWGFLFARTGFKKIQNLERTAANFEALQIPVAKLSAVAAASTELLGGLLLMLGLWSRFASVPLIFTMIVAYLTAKKEALAALTSDPDKFVTAAPFLFLLVSLIVLAFGPGAFSLDRLFAKKHQA